ncbi:MAG: CinA family protein [Betaproteobacteria bacterium]|nr:MAG: CinA family protein [Betaproteobacteria bacterium]
MNELTQLGRDVGELLKSRKDTLAVAESSAGGLISAALLATPGASAYFRGGAVCYTRESRKAFLEPDADTFSALPPSTEAVALAFARAARKRLGTTWAIGETGAAGPTGNRYGFDAGHACIAVSGPVELAVTIETRCTNRELNMWSFAAAALDLLQKALTQAAAGSGSPRG